MSIKNNSKRISCYLALILLPLLASSAILAYAIDANATISTVAGDGISGFSGDGGLATDAQLNSPVGVALDDMGNLYIADHFNHGIRKVIAATGVITTIAGSGLTGPGKGGFWGDGGLATEAQLNFPTGVALDGEGNLYIADNGNHRIRKVVAATGVITTVAGDGMAGYGGDNGPAVEAQLNLPADVAYDSVDNLYIADQDNNRIRKIEASENLMVFLPIIFKN